MVLIPIKNGDSCPICDSNNGDCRRGDNQLIICRKIRDSSGETSELKFVRNDSQGNGMFAPPRSQPADPGYPLESLTAEERDRHYRALLAQIHLHPDDRADLRKRGLAEEQIEVGLFRSVKRWQAVNGLPLGLPGVLPGGSMNAGDEGYLCPVYDPDGLIVGVQLRLRNPEDGCRYIWLTSKTKKHPDAPQPHLKGQLPITVARPIESTAQKNIGMAEGILKPWIAAQKHGQIVIGAAGGLFASSKKHLKAALEALSGEVESKTIDFYPDGGAIVNPQVKRQYQSTWKLLADWGYQVRIGWWEQFAKGDQDIDEIESLDSIEWLSIDNWLTLESELSVISEEKKDDRASLEKNSKLAKNITKFATIFGDRLRLNQVSGCYEFDSKTATLEDLEIFLALDFDVDAPRNFAAVVRAIAKPYHPVREYLEGCYWKYRDAGLEILNNIARRYFGCNSPLHDLLIRKWLIGAARRVFEPGTKFDTVLTLHGKQGFQKSGWFRVLANGWFDDSIGSVSDKDERIKLHRSWINEWGELEATFKRKDIAAIKSFTATQIDRLRPPYGREVIDMPRWSVIVGSTNQDEFLADSTGNRRFWVIPVKRRIDLELLEQERDQIWAAAVALHFQGEQHWLDAEGDQAAAEAIKQYESSDPWESLILDYLDNSGRTDTCIEELLTNVLQVEVKDQDRQKQMRIADILKRAGWARSEGRTLRNGKRVRLWISPPAETANPEESTIEPADLAQTEYAPEPFEPQLYPEPEPEFEPKLEIESASIAKLLDPDLREGDRVLYIGKQYPQFNSRQVWSVKHAMPGYANFLTIEGRFSPWIPLRDLKRAEG